MKNNIVAIVMFVSLSPEALAKSNVDVITTVSVDSMQLDLSLSESISYKEGGVNKTATRIKKTKPEIQGASVGVTVTNNKLYYGFSTQITGKRVA